jgi:hypothetical protein
MSAASNDRNITVGSDDGFRVSSVLDFYAPRVLEPGRTLSFEADGPAEWMIVNQPSGQQHQPATPVLRTADGRMYLLDSTYPVTGWSGATWLLYRAAHSGE